MSPRLPIALFVALIGVLATACFDPKFGDHLGCGPGGECPPGRSCGADLLCHAPGDPIVDAPEIESDAPVVDAADEIPDAATDATTVGTFDAAPDARPSGCQGDGDCATPTDPCSLPGTCNLTTHTCSFPPVVCTQLDTDCAKGTCDPANGACVATPRNDDNSCGAGTTCGPFGTCGGFADNCDENGVQSRSCTVNKCQAGACVGTSTTDTESCQRGSTDGATCGTAGTTGCGSCTGFSGVCGESGTQMCTCVQPLCSGGTCSTESDTSCQSTCFRDTDGDTCGSKGHVCSDGQCECPGC